MNPPRISVAIPLLILAATIASGAAPRSIGDESLVEMLASENGRTMDAAGNLILHPIEALTTNDGGIPAAMVFVPADEAGTCPAFWAARYEVTNFEYFEFLRATNEARTPRHWTNGRFPEKEPNFPATNITRDDALAYCAWLSSRTGRKISLPTVAQANRLKLGAAVGTAVIPRIAAVGGNRRDLNRWGCYDVLGNAGELSLDGAEGATDVSRGFRLVTDATTVAAPATVHASVENQSPQPSPSPPIYVGPYFTQQPESKAVTAGSSVTLSASAVLFPSLGAVSYQWYFNGAPIAGANLPSYTLANVQATHVGIYHVEAITPAMTPPQGMSLASASVSPDAEIASESIDRVISDPAIIAIGLNGTPPTITRQPASVTVLRGETALVTTMFAGTPPLAVRWRIRQSTDAVHYDTVPQLSDLQATSGESSATASYRNPPLGTITQLELIVFGAYGKITSAAAEIRVIAEGEVPAISSHPRSQTVTRGSSAAFQVVANGAPPPVFQWYRNGIQLAGANSDTLTLANVQDSELGSYTVTATNSLGTVTSTPATLSFATSAPSGGGGGASGGGGGAPGMGFLVAAAVLTLLRANRDRPSIR